MARRRDDNLLNVLFDIASAIPWWASILLALISYGGFHALATAELAVSPQRPLESITPMVIQGISRALQYLVPCVFLAGSVASFFRARKRKRLASDAALNPEAIREMSWQDFELLVGQAFRNDGYRVVERGGNGPDGGIDLVLEKGGLYYMVQCKHWRSAKVSVSVVRELQGVISTVNAAGGLVVTSGTYTEDAKRFARETNITLVDGTELSGMLTRARGGTVESPYNHALFQPMDGDRECPKCGSDMVRRKARRGDRAGQAFLGCSRYPSCRGVRNL